MITAVSFVILLGVLIFAHEFGHFIVAKRLGVGVLKFSLGFGRKLIGKKIGETEYLISLIPLGGYVRLLGESDTDEMSPEDEKRSFLKQPVWKRVAIVLAGPLFNLFLAIIIFMIVFMIGIPALTATIGGIQDKSAAMEAGLREGDVVVSIDGKTISRWDEMAEIINDSRGRTLKVTVMSGSQQKELNVTPKRMPGKSIFGEDVDTYKIGITPAPKTVLMRQNPVDALWSSFQKTWLLTKLTLISIVKIFEGVVSPKTLGGPILIAQIAGAQVKEGLVPFFLFMALLSINLAVLNLLPIPVLDGGHLMFYAIEAAIGRPVSLKWREMAQQIGFVILIMLMIFVFMMDIDRLNIKAINDFTKFFTGK